MITVCSHPIAASDLSTIALIKGPQEQWGVRPSQAARIDVDCAPPDRFDGGAWSAAKISSVTGAGLYPSSRRT